MGREAGRMAIAGRMEEFTSFIVMDILESALALERQGLQVSHLEVGEPDFSPPPPVAAAMCEAISRGQTHYTHSLGLMPLREAIAGRYWRKYGLSVSPERICVTTGSSAAFLMLAAALVEPGEPVGLADPGYACYPNFLRLVGGRPLPLPIFEEEGFQLRPEALAEAPTELRTVLISSPANPTGALTGRETYEALLERGLTVISDEIYHDLDYSGQPEETALALSDEVIVVDGFSKRYAMTGCRLGWMVVPPALVRPINRMAQNLYISPPTPSQWGGVAALEQCDPQVAQMREEYGRRRTLLLAGLREIGFQVRCEPQGAFYLFADISRFGDDCFEFCQRMLREAQVAATPGIDFGHHRTRSYVRFAYTRSEAEIARALSRLAEWLA